MQQELEENPLYSYIGQEREGLNYSASWDPETQRNQVVLNINFIAHNGINTLQWVKIAFKIFCNET